MSGGTYDRDLDNPYRAPVGGAPAAKPDQGEYVGYGGFWIRFVAWFIDYVIIVIMFVVLIIMLGVAVVLIEGGQPGQNAEEMSPATLVLGGLFYIFLILIPLVYNAAMISSNGQATVGKMAMGLKVTDHYGQRISFWRAFGREAAKWFLSGIFAIGYIIAAFTERKQGLHDLIASTLVLRTR